MTTKKELIEIIKIETIKLSDRRGNTYKGRRPWDIFDYEYRAPMFFVRHCDDDFGYGQEIVYQTGFWEFIENRSDRTNRNRLLRSYKKDFLYIIIDAFKKINNYLDENNNLYGYDNYKNKYKFTYDYC